DVPPRIGNEDINAVGGEHFQAGSDFRQRERQCVQRQEQILRVRKLGTVSKFVLYDFAPQKYFAVDSEPLVARAAEVVERFDCVDATGAIRLGYIVGIMHSLGATNDSRSPASRRERLAGMPTLSAQRLQPRGVPRPNTVANDGRDVIRDAHGSAGTCSGSGTGSGDCIGSGSGSRVGSLTGSSSGSTTMVLNGLPICMCLLPSTLPAAYLPKGESPKKVSDETLPVVRSWVVTVVTSLRRLMVTVLSFPIATVKDPIFSPLLSM